MIYHDVKQGLYVALERHHMHNGWPPARHETPKGKRLPISSREICAALLESPDND